MTMFFAKKLNKKGFTLAELLIVVAIIAILVAVAIPVFVGQLDKAKKAVLNSAARALKPVAVNRILADDAGSLQKPEVKGWIATAKIDGNGDIVESSIKIAPCNSEVSGGPRYSNASSPFTGYTDGTVTSSGSLVNGSSLDDFVSQYKQGDAFHVAIAINSLD